jgi:hypothetical protein
VSIKFKTSSHPVFAINACSFKHSDPTSNEQISLKPQDLVLLLHLSLEVEAMPTYAALRLELGLAASKVHASLVRAQQAQLVFKDAAGKPS